MSAGDLAHSVEAEQSVLGGLFLDNGAWARVASIVAAADFYHANHRLIFEHVAELLKAGQPADVLTVAETLERAGELEYAGGRSYLGTLAANTPGAANIAHYAAIVRERAGRRTARAIWLELADKAVTPGAQVDELAREGQARIASATGSPVHDDHTGRLVLRCVEGIEARPVRWLWPGRIARGKVSMIAGHPGLGKSQVCASLAAIVTTGGLWPVDRVRCERGTVVIFSAEDDPEDTIRPRLEAAGADVSRCYVLDAVEDRAPDGSTRRRGFSLAADLPRLSAALDGLSEVALVVIDPITAYLGTTDSYKMAEVRAVLAPLGELAARHGTAIVAVSHLRKSVAGDALLQVNGSLAFVAAARAAYVVAKDQGDPPRRLILPLKNNLGDDQTGYAFRVEGTRLASGIETSRVTWESQRVTVTADEALAPAEVAEELSAVADAGDFLGALLADGPVSAKRVRADAEGAGHSWAAVRRAQKELGIVATKAGMKGGWEWRRAPKVLKTTEDAQEKEVSPFGVNEPLRGPDPLNGEAL